MTGAPFTKSAVLKGAFGPLELKAFLESIHLFMTSCLTEMHSRHRFQA